MTAAHRVRGVEESTEIRHTLEHIGQLMQLPAKLPGAATEGASARASSAAAAPSEPLGLGATGPAVRMRWLPIGAAIALVIAGAVWSWPRAQVAMPTALLREWRTDNPNYAGRLLAFTSTQVLITPGQHQETKAFLITAVQADKRADSTHVVVKYVDGGGEVELEVSLLEGTPPRLVFARPAGLAWTPTSP